MKYCTSVFRKTVIIALIIFLSASVFVSDRITEDYSINKWHDTITSVAQSENNIKDIQVISHTPDGSEANIIQPEKYNNYIGFLQSLKVSRCDNKNLCGISKQIVIKHDNKELSILFMEKYIIYIDIYYLIENYSDIKDILYNFRRHI